MHTLKNSIIGVTFSARSGLKLGHVCLSEGDDAAADGAKTDSVAETIIVGTADLGMGMRMKLLYLH